MSESDVEREPRAIASETARALLFPAAPCLVDKLDAELTDEELNALEGRLHDAVEDEIATTIREVRDR